MSRNDSKLKNHLYHKIYVELKNRLLAKKYCFGDNFPSERTLKKEFNVCHLTIRKAMSILVEEKLIERKGGAGTIVTYNPMESDSLIAQLPLDHASLIFESADDYFSRILNFLESELSKIGVVISVFCHHNDFNRQKNLVSRACELKNSLTLLFPAGFTKDWPRSEPDLNKIIILDDQIPNLNTAQIISDDEDGMFKAVSYLADLGHKVVGHISSTTKTTGRNRLKGYRRAVRDLGLLDDESLVMNGAFEVEAGYHACESILAKHPKCAALVCANDYSAFGAMKYLRQQDLYPGKNFSLIGYGNYDISEVLGLSSVDQHPEKICSQIMFFINEYLNQGELPRRLHIVPTGLKIRNSCVKNFNISI